MGDYTRSQFEIEMAYQNEHCQDGCAEARKACEDEVASAKTNLGIESLPFEVQLYIETLEQSLLEANEFTATGDRYRACACCSGIHDLVQGQRVYGKDYCFNCYEYKISKILSRYNQELE